MKLSRDLDRALVEFYRGWDRLERDRSGASIIDFDLAEPSPAGTLLSRDEVAEALQALLERVGERQDPATTLARARLRASAMYLRGLANLESIPLNEYVHETMGIWPTPIPETRIAAAAHKVRSALRMSKRTERIPFSRQGFNAFQHEFETMAGTNLIGQFEHFCGKWVPVLTAAIDADFDPSSIHVEFAEENAYWKNWISGNVAEGEAITLRINVHERHVWYQGAVEILVLHEYCGHAVQMALWRDAVQRGAMSSFFGVLTVHFPDQFLLEGLAECVAHVLPEPKDRTERARHGSTLEYRSEVIRELHTYDLLVLNNVHILANDRGLDAARAYGRQRLPFTSDETIERELSDRTRHPLFRTYQYVYAPAKEAFVGGLEPLPPDARRRALKALYRTPAAPDGVRALLSAGAGSWKAPTRG